MMRKTPQGRLKRFSACSVALVLLAAASTMGARATSPILNPTRALWVTRTTLASPDAIAEMVRAAKAGGFNTLLVQVRGRGDAFYNSTLEPRASELASKPGFDPLQTTLDLAHAEGLAVHAWVAVNLVSSAASLPASRDHVVFRAPEWLMVPRELVSELSKIDLRSPAYVGRLARWTRAHAAEVEGLYTSPLHPAAQAHTAAVIGELARNYAVDGVHLDYVRYPTEDFDYSPTALAQFKASMAPVLTAAKRRDAATREALDPIAYPNLFREQWHAFRRSRLTALVSRIRAEVKAARPEAILSAAVIPDVQQALNTRFQDWRGWLDRSIIDVLCPMAYTTDVDLFQQQIAAAATHAGARPVWAGIGAYRLTSTEILQHIAAANRTGAAGIVLFSYEALISPPNSASTLSDLGRAAFRSGSE